MVSLSAQIMAHPSREAMVDTLLASLDRPVGVTWDRVNDRHDTGVRALEAHDPDATHHLVLQDDTLPCRDLLAGIEKALGHVPEGCPASFYIGRVRPFRKAVEKAVTHAGEDASWVVMDGIYWGPAICVPTKVLPELTEWFRGPGKRVTNYDRRVSRWFEKQALRCWYSWPSLVDHQGDESIVWDRTAVRRAHRFHGATSSALDVGWDGAVVEMSRTGRLDVQRQRLAG